MSLRARRLAKFCLHHLESIGIDLEISFQVFSSASAVKIIIGVEILVDSDRPLGKGSAREKSTHYRSRLFRHRRTGHDVT